MIGLPRALAPWAPLLELFPRDVALAIGPLVQRVASAVGPMRARSAAGPGDPDGFDGLARRGSYERLLVSEWALADEAPDEFARRAAEGEHAFLHLVRREFSGSRVSVALFDAGPDGLGAPRIAHLAALVALARRAGAAGARFAWGALQQSPDTAHEAVTESSVRALLDARTASLPTADHAAAWRAKIAERFGAVEDIWLVGGPRLAALAGGASHLQVRDVLEPGARAIEVCVRRGHADEHALLLELPEDAICARLVRDPFNVSSAPVVESSSNLAPRSNLVFAPNARKLFAKVSDGSLASFPIPNSPHDSPGYPKRYRPKTGTVVAVGWERRSLVLVSATKNRLHVELKTNASRHFGDFAGDYELGSGDDVSAASLGALGPLMIALASDGARYTAVCVLGDGSVYPLDAEVRTPGKHGRAVAAAPTAHGTRVTVIFKVEGEPYRVFSPGGLLDVANMTVDGDGKRAFFGHGGPFKHDKFGLFAVEVADTVWRAVNGRGEHTIAVEAGTVVGVTQMPSKGEPALVVIEPDGRTVGLHGGSWAHYLPQCREPIVSVVAAVGAPYVAYATTSGEVAVFSLAHGTFLYRLAPEGRDEGEA